MTFDLGSRLYQIVQPCLDPPNRLKDRAVDLWNENRLLMFHHPGVPLALAGFDEKYKPAFDAWRKAWQRAVPKVPYDIPDPPTVDLSLLPPHSWFLQFRYTLERPVATGGEGNLSATENTFRTERPTGIPLFAATSWKGAFAAALWELPGLDSSDIRVMMGGIPAGNETEDAARGRLVFFASYFDKLATYTFHPMNRQTKTGTPITVEVAPDSAKGDFSLLYSPMSGAWSAPELELRRQSELHLKLACNAIYLMMRVTGFGGKASSGFGLVRDKLEGFIETERGRSDLTELEQWRPEEPD